MLAYLMIHTADIEASNIVSGTSMTQQEKWTKIITGTPCRVQPYIGRPNMEFDVDGKDTLARIHFYPPIKTERDNRILITSGPGRVGEIWEVRGELEADEMGLFSCVFARLYGKGITIPGDK